MAHFLSDVTHDRLQQRANYLETVNPDRVRTYIPGLTHTHDFAATMRCISVLERTIEDEKLGPSAVVKSWSGDLDGQISIRHGLDGRVVKTIPQEHPNVFVFALQQYKDTMWAGLSNGYLVVYEIATTKKLFETKAHGGAINRFLLGGDKIFIASADWQISQWNAVDMTRITNGSFSGHTNAVRCIALDGSLLYTGGDDCVIRCWDLSTNTERTGTWPIIAHHDSVRDIVIFDSFLFSSSTDGTINVWNIRTAQLVRQLEVVNASITTLCLDTASNYLWAGSSDGNINIWNAATLSLVGVINDHENTNVASVKQVARVDAIKCWTVCDDGNVRIWYADNNPTDEEYLAVAQMEAELQQHIEDHRNRIIANYEQLEAYKKELSVLEQQSAAKKNSLSQLLGRVQSLVLQRKHLAFAMMWLDKQRHGTWSVNVTAPLMEKISNKVLVARYWAGWQAIARERHNARYKKEVGNHLAEYQKEISTRAYLLKLSQTHQATITRTNRANLADALAKTNTAILADRYYGMLKNFVKSRSVSRRMEQLSHCIASQTNRSITESYWQKLLLAAEKGRTERIAANVGAVVKSLADRYENSDEKQRHLKAIADYDERYEALVARQAEITPYVFQLVEDRDNSLALAAAKAEEDEIRELEAFIAANEGHDEDALDRELMEKQMELVRVTAAGEEDLEAQILALQMRNFKLTREHERDVVVKIDTQLTPLQQVDHAMYLLKANGVSCYHHTARREQARARIMATKSAEKVYKEAFDEFKKLIAKAVKPIPLQDGDQPEWFAPREYLDGMKRPAKTSAMSDAKRARLDAMSEEERAAELRKDAEKAAEQRVKNVKSRNKAILEANDCIVDLCVAYDTLNPKNKNAWVNPTDKQWTNDYQHNSELIANIEIFNTIALRAYRILRKVDPITGDPLKARDGSKSPRRAKSKSKSVSSPEKKKKKKKAKKEGDATTKKKKGGKKKTVPKKKKAGKDEKKSVKKTAKKKAGGKKKKAAKKKAASESSPAPEREEFTGASPSASPEFDREPSAQPIAYETPIRHDDDRKEEPITADPLESTAAGPSSALNHEEATPAPAHEEHTPTEEVEQASVAEAPTAEAEEEPAAESEEAAPAAVSEEAAPAAVSEEAAPAAEAEEAPVPEVEEAPVTEEVPVADVEPIAAEEPVAEVTEGEAPAHPSEAAASSVEAGEAVADTEAVAGATAESIEAAPADEAKEEPIE